MVKPISKAGASFEKNSGKIWVVIPENPFEIFPEVAEYYKEINQTKRNNTIQKKKEQHKTMGKKPILNWQLKLDQFLKRDISGFDFDALTPDEDDATRKQFRICPFPKWSIKLTNLVVASGDLSESDKTGRFF